MLTYKGSMEKDRRVSVYLEKKYIGDIVYSDKKMYQYIPKGYGPADGGELFFKLSECKQSLESE